jgi:hypothetical protein
MLWKHKLKINSLDSDNFSLSMVEEWLEISVSRCDISSFKLKGMPFDENCNKVLSSTEDLRPFFEI